MDRYYSGVTVSKLFLGWSGKNGLSGDGLNRIYQLGTSYTYLNSEHYVSIYPQLGYVSWWMAYLYFRPEPMLDRKSTRLNSSHVRISYAVFCLKKKKTT